jgi:hypothetical protein
MTDFAVTGKKRSGKGLFCVGIIRDALIAGKRVATNMDLNLEAMLPANCKATVFRLPDCPTAADMDLIGRGYEGNEVADDKNGVIVLDEASKYFNSRQFGDKGRQPLLDWLIHSGKLRWDVYYQMQGLDQVDKQIRTTQVEYHISVKRTDRWPIPFITPLAKIIGLDVRFPKMHLGVYRHGCDVQALVVDRKFYRAKDLYSAYDTEQVFLDRDHPDATGPYTMLSPWHTKGRYLPRIPPYFLRFFYGVIGYDWTKQNAHKRPAIKPKLPLVASLSKLKPDDALRHWKRLEALGAFNA